MAKALSGSTLDSDAARRWKPIRGSGEGVRAMLLHALKLLDEKEGEDDG